MTKVLVIFTGGTIGSVEKDGVRALHASNAPDLHAPPGESSGTFPLIENYRRQHPSSVEFETRALEPPFLSENATVPVWNRLLKLLKTIDFNTDAAPAGLVVTHGTDTLAHAAAFLSVLLAHTKMPVMLVSSSGPLDHPVSNGHKNFADAISFLQSEGGKTHGVFVPYSYDLHKTVLYLGSHITQSQPFIHRFSHFDESAFGHMEDGVFHATNPGGTRKCFSPNGDSNGNHRVNVLDTLTEMDNCVLLVMPYVGLDYARIDLDKGGIRAVLHGTYHSFTMCISVGEEDKTSSAKWFFAECAKRDIPLYFASCDADCAVYDSVHAMQRQASPGEDGQTLRSAEFILYSSVELAYAKLLAGHNIHKGKGVLPQKTRDDLGLALLSDKSHVDNCFSP